MSSGCCACAHYCQRRGDPYRRSLCHDDKGVAVLHTCGAFRPFWQVGGGGGECYDDDNAIHISLVPLLYSQNIRTLSASVSPVSQARSPSPQRRGQGSRHGRTAAHVAHLAIISTNSTNPTNPTNPTNTTNSVIHTSSHPLHRPAGPSTPCSASA